MRAVRAVRVAEAKLLGRLTIVVLIVGPPGYEHPHVPSWLLAALWLSFVLLYTAFDICCLLEIYF